MITIRSTSDEHYERAQAWYTDMYVSGAVRGLGAIVSKSEQKVCAAHAESLDKRRKCPSPDDLIEWHQRVRERRAKMSAMVAQEDVRKAAAFEAFRCARETKLDFANEPRSYTTDAQKHATMPAVRYPFPMEKRSKIGYMDEQRVVVLSQAKSKVKATVHTHAGEVLGSTASKMRNKHFRIDAEGALSLVERAHEAHSFYESTCELAAPFYSIVCAPNEVRIYNPSTDKLVVIDLTALGCEIEVPLKHSGECFNEDFAVPIDGRLYLNLDSAIVSIATHQFY